LGIGALGVLTACADIGRGLPDNPPASSGPATARVRSS
jgi:hypothetical protein